MASQSGAVTARPLDAGQGDGPEPARPAQQAGIASRGGRELPDAGQPARRATGKWRASTPWADDAAGIVYFTANEGDWRQANVFAVGLDGKNFHRISKENGTHAANFDPRKTKSYVDTYSALTTPPRMSLCTTDGNCNPFWQSRSVEAYNLIAPKSVDFKAADGTTTLQGTSCCPRAGR